MAVLYRSLKPADALPDWAHGVIQLALLAALLYALTHTGWSHSPKDILSVLPMLALVLALSFDRGWLAALLQMRLPQMMGGWSYAVYMGQAFWLQFIRLLEARAYPPANAIVLGVHFSSLIWWLEPVCLVAICMIWGALLARYVEHPAARALKPVHSAKMNERSERAVGV
jgi:peptidoglycan/LPS O-acetylase OafA/YrhL